MAAILDQYGAPIKSTNRVRQQLIDAFNGRRSAEMTYDGARDTAEFANHWKNADSLDADSANSQAVRHKLIRRSRYEAGSSGYYAGIIRTYVNMLVGTGPKLRMMTDNKNFNTVVEREFNRWAGRIGFRRKLWCMAHAYVQDGESFAPMVTNPKLPGDVQLDLKLIEAEQCQSEFFRGVSDGYIDGVRYDQFGNILWYDVLPSHPGSNIGFMANQRPIPIPAQSMLHWYKLERPGSHRGVPSMTSTLNIGATFRRWLEATLATAETLADYSVLIGTEETGDEDDLVEPMSTMEIAKRMLVTMPGGYKPYQLKAEQPSAQHAEFHRTNLSELARPISMPYNSAAMDSSTYSFASGKLDTLCFRSELDVVRHDCDDLVLDPAFDFWFGEWSLVERQDTLPRHQWDWPAHPVIDAVAEANSIDKRLKNGSTTLSQVYSDAGLDFEDHLSLMTADYFGEVNEENVAAMREILLKANFKAAGESAQLQSTTQPVDQLQPAS